jgi:GNAT superfamily N-acetyltransferase
MISIGLIQFETIEQVWREKLWPGRTSAIESHSAMTWPHDANPYEYDMEIFNYLATFFAAYDGSKIIGVNSGHKTKDTLYRSRGLWVDPDYRKQGVAQLLFDSTEMQAKLEGCSAVWSIPRKTALPAYQRFGFETVGGFFGTETSDANIYVIKQIPQDSLSTT